ncbi:Piwi-like protein 2 [Homalodisca vitripennis]|nr:Piwi-like protein 2 [Homalodisca vitripennis]
MPSPDTQLYLKIVSDEWMTINVSESSTYITFGTQVLITLFSSIEVIICYEDGVGDGQLNVCKEHEVQAVEKAFAKVSPDYEPMFVIIVFHVLIVVSCIQVNNCHPEVIICYRDGVGDGQLNVCKEHEVQALEKAFATVSPDYKPMLAVIVCQKRINTRIFLPKNGDFENPLPGSIVDHTITRRYLFDFFLVSQMVRQGTVTPTHYVVLHNTTTMDPDKIQRLTYKMCHLYYNWPGTIRVPAPCQFQVQKVNMCLEANKKSQFPYKHTVRKFRYRTTLFSHKNISHFTKFEKPLKCFTSTQPANLSLVRNI